MPYFFGKSRGSELDGMAIRSLERRENGEPPVYEPDVLYTHERHDGQIVLVPLGPRGHDFEGFKGLGL